MFGKERIDFSAKGGDVKRNNVIEDLLDQHGPGRVVFRNTRSAMSGFPKRKPHLIPIKITGKNNPWIERLLKEFISDNQPLGTAGSEQEFWFDNDPRVDWLVKTMDELSPAKVLLICKTKEKVLALQKTLEKRVRFKVGVFHENLTIVQRDRNAAWFSEEEGARLLLCSEIGSEGRNFQFAHHLILFDLPFHPELLEQRIGRLDRIGQSKDIHIHVPYIIGSSQEVLIRWFHEGLNAFGENLEGGNKLTQRFSDRLMNVCMSVLSPDANKQLESLITDTADFKQEIKETLAKGRDRLLEMNSFRPKIARKIIEQIKAEDVDMGLEIYLTKIFEHFNVEMEDLAFRTYLLHPAPTNKEVFPSIPKKGISVTFDRKRAIIREDISFLSWDHPIATNAIDLVLSSGTGAASFGVIRGKGGPAILLEVLFVLETAGNQNIYVDRFLPNTPLRVVVDHTGDEVTDLYPVETFDKYLKPGQIDDLIENESLMDTILPNMISTAKEIVDVLGGIEISNGLQRMNQTLDHEIERLISLYKKNNHIRKEEIQIALKEKSNLSSLISNARIRLDSLQLIRKDVL